jgi:threonine/homoserine/homoserine lactone efflux protein
MTLLDFKEALLLGFLMAFMIGPIFFMLLQTSVLYGFKKALAFDLGAIFSDAISICIAFYASKPALELIKDDPAIFAVGGLVLLVYGAYSLLKKEKDNEDKEDQNSITVEKDPSYVNFFLKGFLLNFINIGVLGFWLALIVVIGPSFSMDKGDVFQYFGVILLGYLLTDLVKITLAKQLRNKITPEVSGKMKQIMAVIFILFGLALCLKGLFPNLIPDSNQLHEMIDQNRAK